MGGVKSFAAFALVAFSILSSRPSLGADSFACGPGGKPDAKSGKCVCPSGKIEKTDGSVSKCVTPPAPPQAKPTCPSGMHFEPGKGCVVNIDTSCPGGMHFETGKGCIADVGATPTPPTTVGALTIPATRNIVDLTAGNTASFLRKAMPTAEEGWIKTQNDEFWAKTGNFQTEYRRVTDSDFVLIDSYNNKRTGLVLPMSANGWAVIPLDTFVKTEDPDGASEGDKRAWYESIAKGLAASGSVSALILFDNGNGFDVSFSIDKDLTVLHYDDKFMAAGSFQASSYSIVIRGAASLTTSSYGTPAKKQKWIL